MKNLKNVLLIVVLLIGLIQIINAQTNVSGGIYSNTIWTTSNSPYIVVDTVVVFPGVTLTIQPGVTVKFNHNVRLEIRQATIVAEGTASDSIIFTSNSLSPTVGIWSSIFLNDVVNTSRFNYCCFYYANKGIHGNNNYIGGVAYIKNSNFKYNNWGIYSYYSATCFIDSCNFRNNSTGLLVYAYFGGSPNDPMKINKCNFIKNQTGAELWGDTKIINCIIDSNTVKGIKMEQYRDSIINNEIKYNGIGIHDRSALNSPSIVTKNIIESNNIGIKLETWQDSIYCNKICNNTSYDLYYNVSFGSNAASVRYNYWCTLDSIATTARIYDGYDNINLGLVKFMPLDTQQCYLTGCNLQISATVTNATCDTCHNGSAIGHVANGFPPYIWTWYSSPIQTTQTATGLNAGTYSLCVTDGHGCSACKNNIFVDSTNCTGFLVHAYSSNATCSTCADGSAWVNVSAGTSPYYYTWYTIPMQNIDSISGLTNGSYVVCVNDLHGCSACDTVIVSTGNCSAHFNLYPDTSLLHHYFAVNMASGVQPLSYLWNWGEGTTDTLPYPSHTYNSAGFYTICLTITDSAGCVNTFCNSFYLQKNPNTMVLVNVIPQNITGINNNFENKNILIFPNPAFENLTLMLPKFSINTELKVYNLIGQLELNLKIENLNTELNISKLIKGIYIIELNIDGTIIRKKFCKQ